MKQQFKERCGGSTWHLSLKFFKVVEINNKSINHLNNARV